MIKFTQSEIGQLATVFALRPSQLDDWIRAAIAAITGVEFLLFDPFTDDQFPLALPRNAPIGGWTGVDAEAIIRTEDRTLVFEAPAGTPSFVREVLWSRDPYARIVGRCVTFHITPGQTNKQFRIGFDAANNRTPRTHMLNIHSTGTVRIVDNNDEMTTFGNYTAGVPLDFRLILRSRGCHYFQKLRTDILWERLWASFTNASGPLYAALSTYDAAFTADRSVEAMDLAAPWDTEVMDALLALTAPAAGTFAADDDGIIYVKWIAVAAQTTEIRLRWTDNDNNITLRLNQGASTIALVNRTAGVETTATASNTKTFTFVPGTAYAISVRMDGSVMQVLHNNTLIMGPSYSTHTGVLNVNTSHTLDELWFWPIHDVAFPALTRYQPRQWIFYVSSLTGNDANDGLTSATPTRTIDAAAGRATGTAPVIIYLEGPLATPLRGSLDWTAGRNISLLATNPAAPWFLFISQQHTAGWTSLGGGVYSKIIPEFFTENLQNVVVTSLTNADGHDLHLDYVMGITNPAAGQTSWNSATFTCYVHLPGSVDPNIHTIETPISNTGIQVSDPSATMTLQDGKVRYPNIYGIAANGGNIVGTRMDSSYAMTGCFATFGTGGTMALEDCTGIEANNDIYSVHGTATVTLLNCEGSYAGDEIASAHDTTTMTIQGGRYHHAQSGGITSVNTSIMNVYDAEVDNNGLMGADPTSRWGGIAWFGGAMRGEAMRCDCHHNTGPGLSISLSAVPNVNLGTGANANISGLGNNNSEADNFAAPDS